MTDWCLLGVVWWSKTLKDQFCGGGISTVTGGGVPLSFFYQEQLQYSSLDSEHLKLLCKASRKTKQELIYDDKWQL
jgi:hypothetical protein